MAGNGSSGGARVLRELDRLRGGAVRVSSSYLAFMTPTVLFRPCCLGLLARLGGGGVAREGKREGGRGNSRSRWMGKR